MTPEISRSTLITVCFATLNLGITPSSLGSSASFAKLFGQYAFYKPLGSIVFANSIRLGLAKAFSDSFVPTSQLFFPAEELRCEAFH